MTARKAAPAPPLALGITPDGKRCALVEDRDGKHVRVEGGRNLRLSRAASCLWWTAATWPAWMPRPIGGGLPQRLPAWVCRAAPMRRGNP